MSRDILKRLTFPNAQTDLICELVSEHLKFKDVDKMKKSTLKRFFALDRFDLHLELHRIDCLASHGLLDAYEFCQKKLKEFAAEPPPPMKVISGKDLLELGFEPGPNMGKILHAGEDEILEGRVKTREDALEFVKKNYKV
jgi:poly(A) polymerase